MTKEKPELNEEQLDEMQGGAGYLKFEGVEGESLSRQATDDVYIEGRIITAENYGS